MQIGERVRHRRQPDDGIGRVNAVYDDRTCDVEFDTGDYSGVSIDNFVSAEADFALQVLRQLLEEEKLEDAQRHYDQHCLRYLSAVEFAALRDTAEARRVARLAAEAAAEERERRGELTDQVRHYLAAGDVDSADRLYEGECRDWWATTDYQADRGRYQGAAALANAIAHGSLADVAHAFWRLPPGWLSAEDMANALVSKTRRRLARTGVQLDDQQILACARPDRNRLIRARAGSGKTRTLAAFAALAINDENLNPDQVLTLAFNTKAAHEIGDRIRGAAGIPVYRNARTFHSLAHTLVGSEVRELVGNQAGSLDPSTQQQSQYVERVIHRVLNGSMDQSFRDQLYEFFRKEIEDVERLGSHLQGDEYLTFRRSLTDFSLGGDRVKSNGEKFIADFLFEHGVSYRYERVYSWNSADRLDGTAYRPDFTLFSDTQQVILEHWAIDPDDSNTKVPTWQGVDTSEYRRQICDKRDYWQQRGIPLLETHTGMLRGGRKAFEAQLKRLLDHTGIACVKRDHDELVDAVARNGRAISRMAKLFVGFVSRAKKRGWNVEQTRHEVGKHSDREARNRIFQGLALRAYAEYEALLHAESKWDFDDLLLAAIEKVEQQGALARIGLDHNRDSVAVTDLRWILIDEFQDFSELYFRLVNAIRAVNPQLRIVAVGDDWQAINAFAGAQLTFFQHFTDRFAGGGAASVTTNYRSDQRVVDAGNGVMVGLGEPAQVCVSKRDKGVVDRPCDIKKIYVGNNVGDNLYLDAATDLGSNQGKPRLDLAKALKACGDCIIDSTLRAEGGPRVPTVRLLSRTNRAYGLTLGDFEHRLRRALDQHPLLADVTNKWQILGGERGDEPLVQAMTAHRAKGQEADVVVILEATDRNFPKVHADNQLFGLFGVNAADTLAEERRLFYVAVTRAKQRLRVLTESGVESAYLGALSLPNALVPHAPAALAPAQVKSPPLSAFAKIVIERLEGVSPIEMIHNDISAPGRTQLDRLLAAGFGVPEVGYFEDGRCAELAWPAAQPPVAVLIGCSASPEKVTAWRDRGWQVIAPEKKT